MSSVNPQLSLQMRCSTDSTKYGFQLGTAGIKACCEHIKDNQAVALSVVL